MGRPMKYASDADRIRANVVEDENGCWIWQQKINRSGYGETKVRNRTWMAHRLAYEAHVGAIPDGHELDHLCRVRSCCAPTHLEPVTKYENNVRGWIARGTHPDIPARLLPLYIAEGYEAARAAA